MNFVNLEIDAIKKICLKAILADEPIPFGVDMGIDQLDQARLDANVTSSLTTRSLLRNQEVDLTKSGIGNDCGRS